jgi:hypothetical protein
MRPFDLASGPMLRVVLMRLGEGDHVLVLTLHHIASDAPSFEILYQELEAHYSQPLRFVAGPLRCGRVSEPCR